MGTLQSLGVCSKFLTLKVSEVDRFSLATYFFGVNVRMRTRMIQI